MSSPSSKQYGEKHIKAAIVIQRVFRGYRTRVKYIKFRAAQPVFRKLFERKHLIMELVKTEKDYVECLQIIQNVFMEPLLALTKEPSAQIISKIEINEIFLINVIKQMITLHLQLLNNLQEEVVKYPLDCNIVAVMNELAPYLKLYTPYVSVNHKSQGKLSILTKTNTRLREFLRNQRAEHKTRLDLDGYLIMPVQRIPRYVLFFRSIMKNTLENTDEYLQLETSLNLLKKVTEHVNIERKRSKFSDSQEMGNKFHMFREIMMPHRKFHMMVEKLKITGQNSKANGNIKATATFAGQLYNDMFLFYKPEKKKLIGCVYLCFAQIVDVNEHEMSVVFKDITYTLTFDDMNEKERFSRDIKKLTAQTVEQLGKRGIEKPQMLIIYRAKIIHEIIVFSRKFKKKESKMNEVYEELEKTKAEIEKLTHLAVQHDHSKDRVKKIRTGRKNTKKRFSLKNLFKKQKKGQQKRLDVNSTPNAIDNNPGSANLAKKRELNKKKDELEQVLKLTYKKKKSIKKYLSKMKYKLTLCHSQIIYCMGDDRFRVMFPAPITKKEESEIKRTKTYLFKRMLIPVCRRERDVMDVEYYLERSVDKSTIEMNKDFQDDYEAILGTKFKFMKKDKEKKK